MQNSISSHIALKGSNLHIGQHIVALHGRKKTRMLVEAMINSDRDGQGMNREDLRRHVYQLPGRLGAQEASPRLLESQDGSLSKLISRSRSFLKESLEGSAWSRQLDWFVYSDKERKWQLVQIRA
ncbi:MAG: hypothetical protein EOP07_18245 [Proteobacteria bacterium]|nr:MAG: hypothetical protein EOP07_18245 [Pseudomonadota bacterium]